MLAPAQPSLISSVQLGLWITNLQRPKDHRVQAHSCYCCSVGSLSWKNVKYPKCPTLTQETQTCTKKPQTIKQPQQRSKAGFCRKSKKMCRICTFSSGPHMFLQCWSDGVISLTNSPVSLSRLNSCPPACKEDLSAPSRWDRPLTAAILHHHEPASLTTPLRAR